MRCDLHSHSHYSDGAHDPWFVVQRAAANGLTHLAITDHDCLAAWDELQAAAAALPLTLIPGAEISCLQDGRELHVIGLAVETGNAALRQLLDTQQTRRRQRIAAIDRSLQALGIQGLAAHISCLPTLAPGRTQAADFLVQQGLCRDRQNAFRKYLGKGASCYTAPQWCSLGEAIATITAAGGIPVLAHPHRYATTTNGLRRLLLGFREAGGEAVEVSCSNLEKSLLEKLARLALEAGLLASTGSDFHHSARSWMDLGRTPPLPDGSKKNAIWEHPRWHFS